MDFEDSPGPVDGSDHEEIDPIHDIIDYLVRCAKISFKNAHVDETEVKTKDKIKMAHDMFKQSAVNFLSQYGKYLAPYHMQYFENISLPHGLEGDRLKQCINELKLYHSDEIKHKRVRNRRYKALQKLQTDSDYFSDKEMMYRNPLLYEQLVGQFLTDDEIRERDGADSENLTLLNMILETVDRNDMRSRKDEEERTDIINKEESKKCPTKSKKTSHWGEFDTPEAAPVQRSQAREVRKQSMIAAPERRLLREEFLQEMYNSFIDGHDSDVDYNSIDNDEQYDDLKQVSQDAEDKYFDSESAEAETLEDHMKLMDIYGRKTPVEDMNDDPLETFMEHLNKRNVH